MPIRLDAVLREFRLENDDSPQRLFDTYVSDAQGRAQCFMRQIAKPAKAWQGSNIVNGDGRVIGTGEDPRSFFWRGSRCISTHSLHFGYGFLNRIYIESRDRWLTLIPPENFARGKNWTPFVRDNRLFFIHTFSPFRVLEAHQLHENDDFLLLSIVAEHPMNVPKSRSDGFSRLRGGANAVSMGDLVFGIGHTNDAKGKNAHTIKHRPFVFVYKPGESVSYFDFEFPFPDRYQIVDPTSLQLAGDKAYLVTCETEKAWHLLPMNGRIVRYELDFEGEFDEESLSLGGRRIHRWTYGQPSALRRLLGSRRRSETA